MTTQTFNSSGSWTAPAGVAWVDVIAYGPGSGGIGGGTAGGANSGGFGGGGGAYAQASFAVTPGQTYTFTVGKGGKGGGPNSNNSAGSGPTKWESGAVLSADYGRAYNSSNNYSPGGSLSNSNGTFTRSGGHGGQATSTGGGGGGGCGGVGGSGADGGKSTSNTGAAGGAGAGNGGDGGAGGNGNDNGHAPQAPGGGGGGGGGGSSAGSGSAGADGQLVITYSAPSITTTSLANGYVGTSYSQTLAATGGNGGNTWSLSSGSLPPGLSLSSGGVISGTPTTAATYSFTVEVTDTDGDFDTQALSIVIDPALAITTTTLATGYEGSDYATTLGVTGGSGSGYTWSVLSGSLPAGMSLTNLGALVGTPTSSGTFNFTAEVTDSASNTDTQALTLVIYSTVSITTSSLPSGEVSFAYTSTALAVTGGTGTGYVWSLATGSSLPPGLSLSSGGTVSGTPTTAGTYSFTIQVVDSGSHSASKVFSVVIAPVTLPITPSSLPQGTVGTAYATQTFGATGGTSPYTWTVSAGTLPAGLSLSSGGVLSGTPTALDAPNSVTIKVTDAASRTNTATYTLDVYNQLSVTTTSLPLYVTGTAYSTALASTGGDGTNTWSVSVGTLPTGLSLSSAGVLSGTPTATGAYSFTVQVEDTDSRVATHAFTGTVYAPITISTASVPNGYQTVAYSATLAASGGSGTGYTWSLYTGSLPPGLSLSSAGHITGTPTLAESASFTVLVTDSVGITQTKALTLTTKPPLSVATTSLPTAYESTAYSTTLLSAGGSGTGLTWTITSGVLPTPLTLSSSGVISGTPPTGSYPTTTPITVKVTDSAGNTASQALTLTINPQPPAITSTSMSSGTVGEYYTDTLAANSGVPPYSWEVSSGSLPAGLILLSGSGTITGSPEAVGESFVTFEVSDSVGSLSAPVELSITIDQQVSGLPATYGDVDYGTVVYGEVATPARQQTVLNNFVIEPFTATSLNYGSIGVAWTKPLAATNGAAVRWRLISNRYGYPVDQNDGNVLLDTPTWFGTFYLDSAVIPGTYHYYGIYAQTNASTDTWVRVGVTGCLSTENAGKAQWLLSHLPAFFTQYLDGNLTQDSAGNAYLGQFLAVLGWGLDYVQGQYDMQFRHQNDPMAIPIDDLVNLAAQMGMPYDPFISIYLMRKAVANWAHVATERGTTKGIANQIDLLTGWDVDLQLSPNQLLEDDQSWFPDPAFQPWNDFTTYKAGEIVTWQSGSSAWVYQSIAGSNVGNTPTANASNSFWTLMKNADDPNNTLDNATTGGVNTWEAIYPAQTNGNGVADTLDLAIGCPSPANTLLFLANTLKVTNLEATSQDIYIRSVSRTAAQITAGGMTSPFTPDKAQAINDGIPVPFTLPDDAWSSTVRYGTGAIVTYENQPFLALRASTGATPVPGRTATREWQPLSTDNRIRLMLSGEVEGSSAVAMTPFVEWYDQWGNFITRVTARTPTAGTPGIPDQLAFDSFTLNPGSSVSGRAFDNSYASTWTAAANDFTVSQYAGGAVYPNTLASRSIMLTTGPANGQVGVTILTTAVVTTTGVGLVFRYSNSTNYWVCEVFPAGNVALYKNVSGTYSLVTSASSGTVNPGDRIVVQMNGSTINVLLNGTQILTASDAFNDTATQHGIIVE